MNINTSFYNIEPDIHKFEMSQKNEIKANSWMIHCWLFLLQLTINIIHRGNHGIKKLRYTTNKRRRFGT
jgi:hypothetical protein